ncbi:hypothetical protein IE4803_PB00009 (plasmid) [Rhizobium etli bv. phaseoli str. IE4803]|nr:hypothetical protein IE4803_PB00009 [Rhizobium etli bv. phaseoli str. IE4803]
MIEYVLVELASLRLVAVTLNLLDQYERRQVKPLREICDIIGLAGFGLPRIKIPQGTDRICIAMPQ